MYRTEKWYQQMGTKLKTPLCIPSYKRPDAPIFTKGKLSKALSPEWAYTFIRNTPEEIQAYSHLQDKVTLVPLPEGVCDIGTTREAIIQWGVEHGYQNVFMFDDRVMDVKTLSPRYTKNGKYVLGVAPYSGVYKSLLLWEFLQNHFPTTISSPAPSGHGWYPENIDREFKVNNPGGGYVCFCVNVQDLQAHNIHLDTMDKVGVEDTYLIYKVMKAGLPSRMFTDLEFKEVYSDLMSMSTGNNADAGMSRKDRIIKGNTIFCNKVLGIEVGQKNPEITFRKNDHEGFVLTFNYTKYWSQYYIDHRAK